MRQIPKVVISGLVMSVSDKPGKPEQDQSVRSNQPFRLVKISQIGTKGDAILPEFKVYNGAKIEVGKVGSFECTVQAWMMKKENGTMDYGLTAVLIEPGK